MFTIRKMLERRLNLRLKDTKSQVKLSLTISSGFDGRYIYIYIYIYI